MSHLHVGLFSQPGGGKSTIGLSFPGIEQHIFGSSEELTAKNFIGRTDILPPLKLDWMDFLKPEEKEIVVGASKNPQIQALTDIELEKKIKTIQEIATCRKVIRYRHYILKLKDDLKHGNRPDLKTVFLDNATPFFDDFTDYLKICRNNEFMTAQGNFDSIKFSIAYSKEVADFLELFNSLECHTVMSFHIKLAMDEENAAKSDFMKDSKEGKKYPKEWHAMIMGQAKYSLAGKFDYAFYLWTQEEPGKDNKFLAKL